MKKALFLLFACLIFLCSVAAAADVPENYPEIRIDPLTGEPYDLGGQTVYILDYWSGEGGRWENPPEERQAQYDYQDWLMETYNCTIVQKQAGDWLTCADEVTSFAADPDGSLRVYFVEPGKVGELISNGVVADWKRSTSVDLSETSWNQATVDKWTLGERVYGVSTGASEPRGLLFFNKRLLAEAGFDWDVIYDMQANGTWTWDAWEEMLAQTTRDTDNDGVIDIWGVGGSVDDMYILAPFTAGGSFFEFDKNGKLQPTVDSAVTIEALEWAQNIQKTYWMPQPEGASWDWYKEAWLNGQYTFYVYQSYGGFNDNSEMSGMDDEWGAVAFPVSDAGDPYVTVVSENTALIPDVYTDDQISKISLIFDLWHRPTPGYYDEYAWVGDKLLYTDERAVYETYAMLREGEHGRGNKSELLGTQNDILGITLIWSMPDGDISTLINDAMPTWQDLCDALNSKLASDEESGESTPVVYPEVRIDPMTGKPYNLGGRTVYILDYWSGDGSRVESPSKEQQAQYDYQDWLMKMYNCTVVRKQAGDWMSCADEMSSFANDPDGSLRLYIIEPGKVGTLIANGYAADWNKSTTVNLANGHWNQATIQMLTAGNSVYGASTGASEPRGVVYFNKRILDEAGIDWNSIYDMQAKGTWTWDVWEDMLQATCQDLDNDGVIDVWGVGGSTDDMYQLAVYTNDSSFFDFDETGKLRPTVGDAATLEALNWAKDIKAKYWMPTPEDASWDWYKSSWVNGDYAFYVYQSYGGFNTNSEMSSMEDEWGCVAFPVAKKNGTYVTVVSENTALIPNVYTNEEISMITLIYELWTQPTHGYNDRNGWIGDKYSLTDKRAVDETYAMLRKGKHCRSNKVIFLGTQNDVLGSSLLWSLDYSDPAELIAAGLPSWQAQCDSLNAAMADMIEPEVDLTGLDVLNLPKFMTSIGAEAFAGIGTQTVVFPDGCTSIGSRVFSGASDMDYIVVPASVTSIASDAFDGCPSGMKVLVQPQSYAAAFCCENDIKYVVLSTENMDEIVSQIW